MSPGHHRGPPWQTPSLLQLRNRGVVMEREKTAARATGGWPRETPPPRALLADFFWMGGGWGPGGGGGQG